MSVEVFFNAWFVIEAPAPVTGSDLSVDDNYTVQETLPGRMRPLSAQEIMPRLEDRWGRHALTATHRLYLSGRPSVKADYRIRGPYYTPQQIVANAGPCYYIDGTYDPGGTGEHAYIDCWEERR